MIITDPIYNPGSSPVREDGAFVGSQIFAVFDAASAPFSPDSPMQRFGGVDGSMGLSGGEMTVRLTEAVFAAADTLIPEIGLEEVLRAANEQIRSFQVKGGVDDAGRLAGTTFAVVKPESQKLRFIHGGDAFALVAFRDGSVTLTENQVQGHDAVMNAMINEIKREVAEEKGTTLQDAQHNPELWGPIIAEMWNRFQGPLTEARREDVNNPEGPRGGYAFLNGQPAVERMWTEFTVPRQEVEAVLLFSDGMVPWEGVLKNHPLTAVAPWVYGNYRSAGGGELGLRRLLEVARGAEKDTFVDGYTSAEAIGLALDFSDEK